MAGRIESVLARVGDTVYGRAVVLAAICTLLVTDVARAAHIWWCRLRGIHGETPMHRRLNRAVTRADRDPNLPDRWRDPRNVADSQAEAFRAMPKSEVL